MKQPRLKHILIGIFLVIFIPVALGGGFGFVFFARDKIGYCASQGRFLTEEERIHAVINQINRRSVFRADINGKDVTYTRVRYKDANDFLERNPGCCRIEPANSLEIWLNKLGASSFSKVIIEYDNHYVDETGIEHSSRVQIVDLASACGYIDGGFF
jgi:hypothetical protein